MSVPSFRELIGAQPTVASTSDSVLIIIDAQNEYADGKLATRNIIETRASIAALLERFRLTSNGTSSSIIHVVHDTPAGAPVFTPQTALAEEFSELAPKDNEILVHKSYPGAFTDTILEASIKATGKNKVVLVGYMAHVCVSTTARQAAERGYEVVVVSDAVGDRDIPGEGGLVIRGDDLTRTVLSELGDAFATVVRGMDIQ